MAENENNVNNLPKIVGDTLKSTTEANKAAVNQSRELSKQISLMKTGAGMLTNASISLDKYAKSEQKKVSPVKSLKDMFSLTNVKQKNLQEQQSDQIASKLGLTREELKLLQTRKELDESQKKVADEFRENAKKYGVNLDGIKTSFTDMGELLLKNGEDGTASLQEVLGETNANVIKELQAGNVAGRLQKIEADREKAAADARTTGIFEGILQNTEDMEEALIAGFKGMLDKMAEKSGKGIGIGLGLLASPIMLSIGAIMGLKDSLVRIAKTAKAFGKLTIIKPLQGMVNFFKGIGNKFAPKQMEKGAKAISKFTTASAKFFGGVSASLTNAPKAFKAGMAGLKVFRTATGQFGKLGFFGKVGTVVGKAIKPFKGILTSLGSAFDKVKKLFVPIVESVTKIGKSVKTAFNGAGALGKFFGSVKAAFGPIVKMAGSIGRLIGRAFYPITILMSVFDGIKGFIKGFKANGIIGGISGAFFGIVDGLVMKVLDLIKSLFSWIFEKLGFTGISEALDSFSFSEIWQGLGDKVQEFISVIKNWVGDKVSSLVDGFMTVLEGFQVNGIVGGLSAALFAVIGAIPIKVLDLLKGIVSWIAGKLGFTGISEALDSFSFSDIWKSIGDKVQEFISMIRNWVSDKVSGLIDGVKGIFGFGDSDEEKAEKEKNKKRAARLHEKNKKAASNELSSELDIPDWMTRDLTEEEMADDYAGSFKEAPQAEFMRPADDYEAGSLEAIQADFMRAADAKFDAMDGVEVNARSQSAAGAMNIVTVVAPQTSNVTQNSQSTNQTVAVPLSPSPSVASRRSGGRSGRISS